MVTLFLAATALALMLSYWYRNNKRRMWPLFITAFVCLIAAGVVAPNTDEVAPATPVAKASEPGYRDHQLTNQEIAEQSTATSTADATDPPTPRPRPVDRHAERQVAHEYWSRLISQAAIADGARVAAMDALSNGDAVSASALVKKGHEMALNASNIVNDNVPPGWDDVAEHMSNALAGFANLYDKFRGMIDSAKPSEMADALETSQAANDELQQAVHLARVHYIAMGGKASDISDGTAEAKAMASLVHMFEQ